MAIHTAILAAVSTMLAISAIVAIIYRGYNARQFSQAFAGENLDLVTDPGDLKVIKAFETEQRNLLKAFVGLLVGAFVLTGITAATSGAFPGHPEQANASTVSEAELAQAQTDLAVDLEALSKAQHENVSMELLDSSLSPKDAARTAASGYSDALTMPFAAGDDAGKVAEVKEEILRNPVYGVGFANFLKDQTLGSSTIGALNPWMGQMVATNNQEGVSAWLTYHNGDKTKIYVTDEYRTYAVGLCTFIDRLVNQGVQIRQTRENWHLNASLLNNDRKAEKADYQYAKEALVMSYHVKNDTDLLIIGFNIHDKRYELFTDEPVSESEPEPSYTPPTGTGGGTPPTDDENNPNPPTPTPKPPTDDQNIKDPSQDPVNQGNAPVGGGKNDDPGPGTFEKNDHPATSTGASSDAGNSDGMDKSSNQVQDPGAAQDNSQPPATDPIPVTKDTTVTDNQSGQTTNTSTEEKPNKGMVDPD